MTPFRYPPAVMLPRPFPILSLVLLPLLVAAWTAGPLALAQTGPLLASQATPGPEGGVIGAIAVSDAAGPAVASIGDLDGNGVTDLAVGVEGDGGEGAVWILFLDADGAVASHQEISSTEGGFAGRVRGGGYFGASVVPLGDLDGDGVTDLAVGTVRVESPRESKGAVWVLYLNADGTVKAHAVRCARSIGGGRSR